MRHYGSRKIKVEKADLIEKIKENKVRHFEEYNKAVIAYKKEALHQLELQVKRVNDGALNAKLSLVIPVNNSENYDKIIEMFEWELQDIVE
jgi:hypothetical protein